MTRRTLSWRWILALNLALAAAVSTSPAAAVPDLLRMLASGVLVLILPGVAWLGLFRSASLTPARLALAVTGISSLATAGALLITTLGPEEPSRGLVVAWLVLFINSGQVLAGAPSVPASGPRWGTLALVAGCGFLVTAMAALWLVPPLEDHDMELRGSAWGLAADFQPWYLTNRELYVQAAHPIFFHLHISESLLLTGELAATRPSYDSAMRARQAEERGEAFPWMEAWEDDYRRFMDEPALVGTRAPSVIFSALALALLCHAMVQITGRYGAALAACALFLSFPETLVRASYAGYFPVTFFACMVLVLLFSERTQGADATALWKWLLMAGLFAALVNHKTVVLVLALLALGVMEILLRVLRRPTPPLRDLVRTADTGLLAMGVGFFTGTLAWWSYSWSVHPASFIEDHLRKHIAHRILLNDFRLGASEHRYAPGMLEVWAEFNAHCGYVFIPVALAATSVVLYRWLTADEAAAAQGGSDPARSLAPAMALWFLTGAVLYTVTDWRQTKHLMNQLAPMVVLATAFAWPWPGRTSASTGASPAVGTGFNTQAPARALRLAAAGLLALALCFNLATDFRLIRDFTSLTISGASAIDGW